MSFKIGDRVKLTGFSWPRATSGSLLPERNSILTITEVLPGQEYGSDYRAVEYPDRLYISDIPSSSWGGMAVHELAPEPVNPRTEGLNQAIGLIDGDREGVYGDPLISHQRIAKLWSALLDVEITAAQVAMMMAAMKLSRLTGSAEHKDSWIDLAGYAGLGYEFAVRGSKP